MTISRFPGFVLLLLLLSVHLAPAQQQGNPPDAHYVFFLHNRFLELNDTAAVHPQYGKAEYGAILRSFRNEGFIVYSEKRSADTDAKAYAKHIVKQADSLLKAGIKPGQITVIGTSKGGYIAQYVSTYLANPGVNFVFIGCYQDDQLVTNPDINFCGNILTIYEKTDSFGVSAARRKETSKLKVTRFKEIELHTNLKHGFLYRALPEWLEPCKQWARNNYEAATGPAGNAQAQFEKLALVTGTDTLPYRLLQPLNNNLHREYPLLIYLHGAGTRGNDNEKHLAKLNPAFTDSFNRATYPCYVLVPHCAENDAWALFPGFPNSLATLDTPTLAAAQTLRLIHELMRTKNIDENRIYLTGFSLGAEGTFDLLTREPGLFACAVPVAGVADTARAKGIRSIPLWAFHGSNDQVTEVKYTRMMIKALEQQGGKPIYTEVAGAGHNCTKDAYANPALWKWMFSQRKKTTAGK